MPHNRTAPPDVWVWYTWPLTLVMDLQTLVQVIGPAAVKRAVRTGEDIGIIHGYPSFPVNKLLTAIKGRPFKGVPFLFHFIR